MLLSGFYLCELGKNFSNIYISRYFITCVCSVKQKLSIYIVSLCWIQNLNYKKIKFCALKIEPVTFYHIINSTLFTSETASLRYYADITNFLYTISKIFK